MMNQIIIGGSGSSSPPAVGSAKYCALQGDGYWYSTESYVGQIISIAGTLKNLRIRLSTAPGAGKSYNIRLMKNGVAQSLQVTISDTDTTGYDDSNTVSVSPGDRVSLRCTPSGTPAATYAQWAATFTVATAGANLVMGNPIAGTAGGSLYYAPLMTGNSYLNTTESDKREIIPTAGKLKNLYVRTHAAIGGAQTLTYTVRVNGVDTALTCTIPNSGQTASNTADEVSVSPGDIVTLKIETTGNPGVIPFYGCTFVSDLDGESIVMNCPYGTMHQDSVRYNHACGTQQVAWGATESDFYQLLHECTVGKLYVQLTGAPGLADDSYALTIRVDGADTDVVVTISGTNTTGHNELSTGSVSDGSVLDIEATPTSHPTSARGAFFGFVINPTGLPKKYPSHDLIRVTGIRHIYRPGSYRLEATLGDVSTSIELPQRDVRIPSVVPTKEVKPEKAVPLRLPERTAPELIEALREEGLLPEAGASADVTAAEPLPIRPGILDQIRPLSREDLERLSRVIGREAPPEPSLWQRLTPWKEERGETFGTAFTSTFRRGFEEVAKLGEFYKRFFGGWFG